MRNSKSTELVKMTQATSGLRKRQIKKTLAIGGATSLLGGTNSQKVHVGLNRISGDDWVWTDDTTLW